ncbi:MAG: TetR/AcrR family transcriptional regulator [Bacteroidales bacterium]|nr:TetR/AcrR family transcriptional regulator [Clostridium sp.]MCM1204195.1 TetR/AcrR family transcriptional regulator [Bacteroidales bacterium]
MAEDRRVRKTKKAIQDVFCELTKEKRLNEITVKELCAKADINKSTFYLHYRDIYDLANSIQSILIEDVCAIIDEYPYDETISKAPEMWSRIAQTHFKDSKDLGVLMGRPGMLSMVWELEAAVVDTIMKKFVNAGMKENSAAYFQHHLYVTFIINGYLGVLRAFDVSEMEEAMLEVSKRISTGFNVEIG